MTFPQFLFDAGDKRKFATELLKRPNDPLGAAIAVFGDSKDTLGKCSFVANFWPNDAGVVSETQKLLGNGGVKNFLPTKEEAARRVWEWANASNTLIEDRIKSMKLFCEIMDFIAKPGTQVNVTVPINKVMLVSESESDAAWEKQVAAQQERLIADGATVH